MIWRLTYCNKEGVGARIDIIRGNRTPTEIVQGSGQPFTLAYKLDKNDKSGHIMTSSADIEIFETETFNIDDLKTSNETELKVEYFEDNILTWSGFILPDFFSREIGSPNIVRMTASDRLTALKGITLSDLPSRVSLRNLIELSLAQTGLSLGLVSQIQINQGSTNILDSEVLSQRLTDVRGRSVNCYDILMSIMVGTNSTIRQRAGQWQVYNKLEHELRTPTIFFDKVERGAIRTIQPVASSVGVYQEHGGGLNYPTNYDFSDNLNGWSAINGFTASIDNRQVSRYSYSGGNYIPSYEGVGDSNYVVNKYNNLFTDASSPYLKSDIIGVIYPTEKSFNIEVEVNATNAMLAATNTVVDFAIIIEGNGNTLSMDGSGLFNEVVGGKPFVHRVLFPKAMPIGGGFISKAATASKKVKGLAISPDENFEGYTAHIRIYGSGGSYQALIHSVTLTFSSTNDVPKGNIFKTTQGSNFTKQHDIETVIFGDYITSGLNGYFYNYPIDDTSNLYLPSGILSSPTWVTAFDTTERPLLHHVSRQKSHLFSVAHDILKANINVESFDPLAVFQDCKGGKYVVVSAIFDFLRSEVNVELEQIAYDNAILKRDFIYSYFGEGEDTIKSIGGISSGGGGAGGGGMTSEQLEMLTNLADWWRLDEENDAIYSLKSVYSLKGVSALGLGSGGGGGGGDFDRLDAWVDYNETKANWVLSALLGYDLHTRVNDLEAGGGASNIEIAVTGSGNAVTGVSKSGNTLTFAKSSTFALSTHTHTIANITGLQDALDSKLNLTGGAVSGAIIRNSTSGQTSNIIQVIRTTNAGVAPIRMTLEDYDIGIGLSDTGQLVTGDWGSVGSLSSVWDVIYHTGNLTSLSQLTDNIGVASHIANSTIHITANERTNWNDANSKKHTHSNKALLDLISQSNIDVLEKLSVDGDGNIKVDTTLWATGGISALGLGSNGGGGGDGGADMLQSWETYTSDKANYYVPASLLVPFRTDALSRLAALESGSATSIVTTGSGNAITSLTKSGSVITANKGLTFALASHSHTFASLTNKPTTIAGYNITDAYTKAEVNSLANYVGRYDSTNGFLVKTDVGRTENAMLVLHIKGNSYGGLVPIDTFVQAYNFVTNDAFILTGALNNGYRINEVKVFYYNNLVYFWIPQQAVFQTMTFQLLKREEQVNRVDSVTNAAVPSSGVEKMATITPRIAWFEDTLTNLSQLTDNIGVGSHIANKANPHSVTKVQVGLGSVDNTADSAKNVLSATKLTTARTIWGQSFDGTVNVSGAITGATTGNFTGSVTANNLIISSTVAEKNISFMRPSYNYLVADAVGGSIHFITNGDGLILSSSILSLFNNGSVGIGKGFTTVNPTDQLEVRGTGRFTGNVTAPTFIGALSGNATSATNLSRSVVAGNGLTGGGVLDANRTLTLGTPSNITLSSTNSVATSSHTHSLVLGGTASQYLNGATTLVTIPTITAGNGLSGGGQLTATRSLALGTPSTLTNATTNGVTATSHTHAITTTTVGAVNTIVATDASGGVRGNIIRIGGDWTLELSGTELLFKYGGVVKQRMFQDGSFVATGEVAAYSQGVVADTLDLLRLNLNQGGGDSKYLSSTATQIYFDIAGATPLSMTKTEVRRGATDNNVNLGTSAYPWANIYGVNLIASTDIYTPKITLGNGWTIEQTAASLTIRKGGIVKGTFTA